MMQMPEGFEHFRWEKLYKSFCITYILKGRRAGHVDDWNFVCIEDRGVSYLVQYWDFEIATWSGRKRYLYDMPIEQIQQRAFAHALLSGYLKHGTKPCPDDAKETT